MEFQWSLVPQACTVLALQGVILLAAAKHLFAERKDLNDFVKNVQARITDTIKSFELKMCDSHGISIFVTKKEWKESKDSREERRDAEQERLCRKIDEVQKMSQDINELLYELLGSLNIKNINRKSSNLRK